MSGGSSAPPAPDYSPIVSADTSLAQQAMDTGQAQLGVQSQAASNFAPVMRNYLDSTINAQNSATGISQDQYNQAKSQEAIYNQTYLPVEQDFANKAQGYDTLAREGQASAAAMGDVASQMNQARTASLSNLESFGIDPSQTRYGALDLSSRIQGAASQAAAGTQARQNTEAQGLGLESQAIGFGKNYAGNINASLAGAGSSNLLGTQEGMSGISANNSTASTYGNLTGTAPQWAGAASGALGGASSALNAGYSNALSGVQANNQLSESQTAGVGSAVGTIAMAAAVAF